MIVERERNDFVAWIYAGGICLWLALATYWPATLLAEVISKYTTHWVWVNPFISRWPGICFIGFICIGFLFFVFAGIKMTDKGFLWLASYFFVFFSLSFAVVVYRWVALLL